MLEKATLDVLAHAAEVGLPEAAAVPASAYDPLVRPLIRKNVKRAVDAASARTTKSAGDHVLRLAFLGVHPNAPRDLDPNDDRAVTNAFTKLAAPFLPPPPPPKHENAAGAYRAIAAEREAPTLATPPQRRRKAWPFTHGLLVSLLLTTLTTAGIYFAPLFIPSPIERFRGTTFGKALGEPLTDFVVNTPKGGSLQTRYGAKNALLDKKVKKQIGPEAFASFETTIGRLPEAIDAKADSTDDALAPLITSVNETNRKLAAQRVPALLHTYASGSFKRSVWITSYYVDQRFDLTVDGRAFQLARGRRLDSLNLLDSALYKGDAEDWIIVSLDHIEEELVQGYLAPLALGKPMGPEEYGANDTSPRAELSRLASRIVIDELRRVTKVTPGDATELLNAIGHRNDTLVGLGKVGFSLEPTSRIWLRPAIVKSLEHSKENGGYEAKLAAETLRMNDRMKLHAKALQAVISEIARVEEDQFVGRLAEEARSDHTTPDGESDLLSSRRNRGVAAGQLGMLARKSSTPRLAFWTIVRRATDKNASLLDRAVARRVLVAMFKKLGIAGPQEVFANFDDVITNPAMKVLELPADKVEEAASRAFFELFGHPVPALERKARP